MYLSFIIGLMTGSLVSIFLALLGIAQYLLIEQPWFVYLLPVAALIVMFLNQYGQIPHHFGVKKNILQLQQMNGAPLAAVFFVIELYRRQESIRKLFLYGIIASLVAYVCTQVFQVKHTQLPHLPFYRFQFKQINYIVFSLFCFALMARTFKWLLSQSEYRLNLLIQNENKRLFAMSFIYLILILILPGQQWIGLGTVWIEKYFLVPAVGYLFLIKLFVTVFCIAIGFRGGEFIPLLFIGATMGNYFAQQFGLPISLMAALGFIAIFSGASRLFLTSIFLAIELFGWEVSGWALLAILMSFLFSGKESIYQESHIKSNQTNV